MKLIQNSITILPSGFGHNKIICYDLDKEKYSTVTSNTRLTDKYRSDDENESDEAKKDLIELVMDDNNIADFEIV